MEVRIEETTDDAVECSEEDHECDEYDPSQPPEAPEDFFELGVTITHGDGG